MRQIELLAPAKNADIGIEAIRHGADAVYIGASEFGARAAAGNDIDDIRRLVDFAHIYRAKVYVTVNTIIYDGELDEVERLIWELYRAHVDALIIQDFGILGMNLPPIPLHASTQMDNRTAEKVEFLRDCGFEQVVLARELTAQQIGEIHNAVPDVNLEVFVHGAMCVSYSGQCYASEAIFGRSANRGECAQLCRMDYDLVRRTRGSRDEQVLAKNRKLLSIRDNCQLANLERLLLAGASSLKIEGRLKDVDYVKNITADYSRKLDEIISRHPQEFERASSGRTELTFVPNWEKSFFRHFEFQAKSVGEHVGRIKDIYTNHFTINPVTVSKADSMQSPEMHNGDGVCIVDAHGNLIGFRINKVDGYRLFPLEMPRGLQRGMDVYRNQDDLFERLLSKKSADRRIPVNIVLDETPDGFSLTMTDADGHEAALQVECERELARSHQTDNIRRQLGKLGDTPFVLDQLDIRYKKNWFIPSSLLSEWRRTLSERLLADRVKFYPQHERVMPVTSHPFPADKPADYLYNVANANAEAFYRQHGVDIRQRAFELTHPKGETVMFCKHCIRRSLNLCPKRNRSVVPSADEDLYLKLANGREFRLEFDCQRCEMRVVYE